MANVVVLRGVLSRPPVERVLPSGDRIVTLEVTTRRDGESRAETAPVAWPGAPGSVLTLDAGAEVVVIGHVARRFFRAGGGTQSRTEVVAHGVYPGGRSKRLAAALGTAAEEVLAATQPAG